MKPDADIVYEIRSHLLYELKWLVYAAARFQRGENDQMEVALIDSATVHARNLFEFAGLKRADEFTLHTLGGTAKPARDWDRWANNRVIHMRRREHHKAPWPAGLDNSRPDRLMVMAGAVLDRLEDGGQSIPPGDTRNAYIEVLGAARRYWSDPSDANHELLAALYDDSRDEQAEPY